MPEDTVEVQKQEETPTPETTSELNELPSYDAIAFEFSDNVADTIKSYANKIPLIYMVKILQNLCADLLFQNVAVQVHYKTAALEEKVNNRSKLII